ncbi:MAG: alpha/beta hydrolase [Pseudomonadota bacterium]
MAIDWDDAYANGAHIPEADAYFPRWQSGAAAFRAACPPEEIAYGPGARNRLDLFRPDGAARGLVVFVHGGYWRISGREDWSHLAAGPVAAGWAVALPSYTLCPDGTIAGAVREVAAAIDRAAAEVAGPVRLTGHSAGGHLVTRMLCEDVALGVSERVSGAVAISGIFDLRPLTRTAMNADFGMDLAAAGAESPALLVPRAGARLVAWVGADERPEFRRQSALIANIWQGFGVDVRAVEAPGRHHFDVIADLESAESVLTRVVLDGA